MGEAGELLLLLENCGSHSGAKVEPAERGKLQHQLNGVRAAAKALGDSTNRELKAVKKRVLSAAARAKISKATKERWAKFRAAKAKGKH